MEGKSRKQLSDTLKEFCGFLKGCEYLDAACLGVANVYNVVEFWANTRGLKKPAFCCKSIIIPWIAIATENLDISLTFGSTTPSPWGATVCGIWHSPPPGANNTHYIQSGKRDFIHPTPVSDVELATSGTHRTHFIPITAIFDKWLVISSEANSISLDDDWSYMSVGGACGINQL